MALCTEDIFMKGHPQGLSKGLGDSLLFVFKSIVFFKGHLYILGLGL